MLGYRIQGLTLPYRYRALQVRPVPIRQAACKPAVHKLAGLQAVDKSEPDTWAAGIEVADTEAVGRQVADMQAVPAAADPSAGVPVQVQVPVPEQELLPVRLPWERVPAVLQVQPVQRLLRS